MKQHLPISIIIVNWNSGALLQKCLAHLDNLTCVPEQIFIVDNNSTDESCNQLISIHPLQITKLDQNLGFAAANNYAIKRVQTPWVALLNPDAFPNPEWLENLWSAVQTHPDAASFSSLQLMDCAPARIDGKGDFYHISGLMRRRGFNQPLNMKTEEEEEVFSPCAAAALYNRESLISVGLFEESYFCYCEDVDLGFRLRLAGYKCVYIPSAIVTHIGSATSGGRHSDFAVYHGQRNMVWTYIRNMPPLLFIAFLPIHFLANIFSLIALAKKGRIKAAIRAKMDAIRSIRRAVAARRQIQAKRTASTTQILKSLSILIK